MGVGPDSFTSRLIETIQKFGGKAFTALQLYERLIQDGRHLTTPQYHLLGRCERPSVVRPSIVLERLQLASRNDILEQTTNMFVASVTNRPPQDSQEPLMPSNTEFSLSSGEIRVLLTLSLPGNASVPDLQRWNEWLSGVPCDVLKDEISIQAAFRSNSTLLLLSMPISVWHRLPDSSAYRFVDFIRSENLWTCAEKKTKKNTTLALIEPEVFSDDRESDSKNSESDGTDFSMVDIDSYVAVNQTGTDSQVDIPAIGNESATEDGQHLGEYHGESTTIAPNIIQTHLSAAKTTEPGSLTSGVVGVVGSAIQTYNAVMCAYDLYLGVKHIPYEYEDLRMGLLLEHRRLELWGSHVLAEYYEEQNRSKVPPKHITTWRTMEWIFGRIRKAFTENNQILDDYDQQLGLLAQNDSSGN